LGYCGACKAEVEWKITIVVKKKGTSEVVVECPSSRLSWRTGRFE